MRNSNIGSLKHRIVPQGSLTNINFSNNIAKLKLQGSDLNLKTINIDRNSLGNNQTNTIGQSYLRPLGGDTAINYTSSAVGSLSHIKSDMIKKYSANSNKNSTLNLIKQDIYNNFGSGAQAINNGLTGLGVGTVISGRAKLSNYNNSINTLNNSISHVGYKGIELYDRTRVKR